MYTKHNMTGLIQMTLIILSLAHIFRATAGSISDDENLDQQVIDDEVKHFFFTGRHATPAYEIVKSKSTRVKRSISSPVVIHYSFSAHERKINLTLQPTNEDMAGSQTPIWTIKKYSNDDTKNSSLKFHKVSENLMNGIGQIWEDPENHATVLIRSTPSGQQFIRGYVPSENFIFGSLVSDQPFKNPRFNQKSTTTDSILQPSVEVKIIVYKIPQNSNKKRLEYLPVTESYPEGSQIPGPPDTIYPEILLIVEYLTYKDAGENIKNLLEYLLPFWYSVDMLFRGLESPKVRLHIAAIVIAVEDDIFPFVCLPDDHKRIFQTETLNRFGKFLTQSMKYNFPLDSFDQAVLMTPRILCEIDTKCINVGVANIGQSCPVFSEKSGVKRVAIIFDEGLFYGVITAAHELGHLMGVGHDQKHNSSITDCIDTNSHVMNPIRVPRFGGWSECSKKYFKRFFNSRDARCLFNIPRYRQISETATAHSVLTSGRFILDEMCYKKRKTTSCLDKVSKNCQILQCRKQGWNPKSCYNITTPLKDGAICDVRKICFLGQCVDIGY